jgi:hypothetical protein
LESQDSRADRDDLSEELSNEIWSKASKSEGSC